MNGDRKEEGENGDGDGDGEEGMQTLVRLGVRVGGAARSPTRSECEKYDAERKNLVRKLKSTKILRLKVKKKISF